MHRPVSPARTRNHHATSTASKEKNCNTLKDNAAQSALLDHSKRRLALQWPSPLFSTSTDAWATKRLSWTLATVDVHPTSPWSKNHHSYRPTVTAANHQRLNTEQLLLPAWMAPNLNTPFHTSRLALVPTAKVTYTLSPQAEVPATASDKRISHKNKNGLTPLWRPTDGTEFTTTNLAWSR